MQKGAAMTTAPLVFIALSGPCGVQPSAKHSVIVSAILRSMS